MPPSDTDTIFAIASSGMQAQAARMRVVAGNIANAGTTPSSPSERPYQRQVITFRNEFDRALGAYKVKVAGVQGDSSPFVKKYDPSHPAADAQGYIQTPNVKPVMEGLDLREAQRAYDANLSVIEAARLMLLRTIDLLRS